MHPQLPLEFEPEPSLSFDTFWEGDNAVVLDLIRSIAAGKNTESQVYLHGGPQTGKTHLLSAACQSASHHGYRIAYLSANQIGSPQMVEGFEGFDLVCLDDLHGLMKSAAIERAVFSLFNDVRDSGGRLLLASRTAPSALGVSLPDLKTRLSWGASFGLGALTEQNLQEVLRYRLRLTGSVIGQDVLDYLCNHFSRDIVSMLNRLRELDRAAVQAKRKITIPFVKEILGQGDGVSDRDSDRLSGRAKTEHE